MQYSVEIAINVARDRVIELFDSAENLKKWQEGLESFEHISGEPGQVGAKSKLIFNMNGRIIEMIETITSRNFPREFSGTYEAKGVFNSIENHFYDLGAQKTRWVTENEFKFSGIMWIMSFFMKGSFRKQTLKTMEAFKTFAENA